ncbi:alpha/beta fold hydrolase [Nocardia mexicana]|uniref:Pimeloyl-ACP methyl ester carboxylesterase n=1 Tax=Nocardia mexicana TaxID=279262 RepID=A0A370H9K6_9NOCA|nr:alpha/beta hydrolase [Nocardia mexicana]RDI53352.1 pimeloyl-ACP methyl ester carboxylesterase [Nocardia mexicana]
METAHARSVRLSDGRRLGYYEFGDPDGVPCVYVPGWPASGLLGGIYDAPARDAGVRWISVDKPGIGNSTADPRRSLLGYADDLARLADDLGLDRFAVVGESGGAPHTFALAHARPDRLTTAIVVAGMGPAHEKNVREGMGTTNRRLITLARRAPWLLRLQMLMLGRMLRDPAKAQRWERSMRSHALEAERQALDRVDTTWLTRAAADALRDGGRAATEELAMITRPWGFALSDITVPVELWHGAADRNVPVAIARRLIDEIPSCTPHILDGYGHSIGAAVCHDVMAAVRKAARD